MKLAAAVIVRNERRRYLAPVLAHLLEFCDEIRVLDDGSNDGWSAEYDDPRIVVRQGSTRDDGSVAFNHHAAARNQLLQHALEGNPDWVLAIDADEVVSDGAALRAACEQAAAPVLTLVVEEVWEACDDRLCTREDGGWAQHPIGCLWRPEPLRRRGLEIRDQGHATGRVPAAVYSGQSEESGVSLLHFGWANVAERPGRFERYAVGDAGKYHAKQHIDSIMWPPDRVGMRARPWPAGLAPWREELLAQTGKVVA